MTPTEVLFLLYPTISKNSTAIPKTQQQPPTVCTEHWFLVFFFSIWRFFLSLEYITLGIYSSYFFKTTRNSFSVVVSPTQFIVCFFFSLSVFWDCFLKIILFYNYIKNFYGFKAKSTKKVYSEKSNFYPSHTTLFLPSSVGS